MAKTAHPRDPVSIVIPAFNVAARLEAAVPAWAELLARYGRECEIIVVDEGSTDGTTAVLERLAARVKPLRILKHDRRRGFGACLRTALADVRFPLLFATALDYPYTPSDLRPMLERIELRDQIFNRQPDLIHGCRTGRRAPFVVRAVGRSWRLFWRIAIGMEIPPATAWLGMREWLFSHFVGSVFGVPFTDPNCAFTLYRTAFLRRFPIQSDGDFARVELAAKATFLTSIMDEVALTPRPDPIPTASRSGLWTVLTNAEFARPRPPAPAVPPPTPVPVP